LLLKLKLKIVIYFHKPSFVTITVVLKKVFLK